MRILTVRPPWSAAIIHSGKNVENRARNIAGAYRGPVAIHAGKQFDHDAVFPDKTPLDVDVYGTEGGIIRGAIIGVVDLVGSHLVKESASERNVCFDDHTPTGETCSPWALSFEKFVGHRGYHLVLANPRALVEPIPYTGALGLRRLDDDTTARILAQIGEPA